MTQQAEPIVVFPLDARYPLAHLSRVFGVQPERSRLELRGENLIAVFGPWRMKTTISNVDGVEITGPYAPWKVLGPPHLSFADGGLTFATNWDQGICLRFREPVPGFSPLAIPRHGSLTITVEDPERVRDVLERAIRTAAHAPDEEAAIARVEQDEQDAIHALSAADLRERARVLGVENANSLSHRELVEIMETGGEVSEDHD